MKIAFIVTGALLAYIYVGYPALLWFAARLRRRKEPVSLAAADRDTSAISLIIAARNEETTLPGKIENMKTWDFPSQKLQIILVSDGSTDRTVAVFEENMRRWTAEGGAPSWSVIPLSAQRGKSLAQNEGVLQARHPIFLFSDAGAHYEPATLRILAEAFKQPRVGCVTGKTIYRNSQEPGAAFSEGAYFRYESWIRSAESAAGVLAMGSGCILAIRRDLFEPLRSTEGEDWALCLHTVEKGYEVVQVNDAVAYEEVVTSSQALFRTKVRIISKDFLTLLQRRRLMNPLVHGRIAVALLSHKWLRWFSFLWMLAAFILNACLWKSSLGWALLLGVQVGFYALALLGALAEKRADPATRSRWANLLAAPYNFCVVQAAAALGIWKALTGRSEAVWQPIREPVGSDV